MFKVIKTPKTPNIIWDGANNRPLCKFVNGVVETNDEVLASKLASLGHTVEGKANTNPLDKMKLEELKAYAEEHNIDLGDAAKKDEILKAIQEAGAEQ